MNKRGVLTIDYKQRQPLELVTDPQTRAFRSNAREEGHGPVKRSVCRRYLWSKAVTSCRLRKCSVNENLSTSECEDGERMINDPSSFLEVVL